MRPMLIIAALFGRPAPDPDTGWAASVPSVAFQAIAAQPTSNAIRPFFMRTPQDLMLSI